MSKLTDQFGQKSMPTKSAANTKGNPVKHESGTANKGTTVKVHRPGK